MRELKVPDDCDRADPHTAFAGGRRVRVQRPVVRRPRSETCGGGSLSSGIACAVVRDDRRGTRRLLAAPHLAGRVGARPPGSCSSHAARCRARSRTSAVRPGLARSVSRLSATSPRESETHEIAAGAEHAAELGEAPAPGPPRGARASAHTTRSTESFASGSACRSPSRKAPRPVAFSRATASISGDSSTPITT